MVSIAVAVAVVAALSDIAKLAASRADIRSCGVLATAGALASTAPAGEAGASATDVPVTDVPAIDVAVADVGVADVAVADARIVLG